ncbi:MAG: hypothetical protein HFG73_08330 [Hungatella sp.]|nr:hypothetical protein [Hungatella sp.]
MALPVNVNHPGGRVLCGGRRNGQTGDDMVNWGENSRLKKEEEKRYGI